MLIAGGTFTHNISGHQTLDLLIIVAMATAVIIGISLVAWRLSKYRHRNNK